MSSPGDIVTQQKAAAGQENPCRGLAWAWSAQIRQSALLAGDQQVDVGDVGRGEAGARPAQRGRGDGTPPCEQVLADREAEGRLLLVAGEREVGVEQVVGALRVA